MPLWRENAWQGRGEEIEGEDFFTRESQTKGKVEARDQQCASIAGDPVWLLLEQTSRVRYVLAARGATG